MPATLSSSDFEQTRQAIELLLSPLDTGSVDEWRAGVSRRLRDLLFADSAGFVLPGVEGPPVYSDEHDPEALSRYPEILPPLLPDGRVIVERAFELGACTDPILWGEQYDEYLKSAYRNEYAAANRACDAMTAVIRIESDLPMPMAGLHFWHSSLRGRQFGPRELQILRLVLPGDAGRHRNAV